LNDRSELQSEAIQSCKLKCSVKRLSGLKKALVAEDFLNLVR